jgi:hypothetical protein
MSRWVASCVIAAGCGFDPSGNGSQDTGGIASTTAGEGDASTSSSDPSTTTSASSTSTTSSSDDESSTGPGATTSVASSSDDDASSTGDHGGPGCGGIYWSAALDVDPTTLDDNTDGIADWSFGQRGFPVESLVAGAWQAEPEQWLRTAPDDDFATRVLATMRMRTIEIGTRGATFFVNMGQDDESLTRLWVNIALEDDGTQSLAVGGFVDEMDAMPLLVVPGLGADFIEVALDADVATGTVAINIDGNDYAPIVLPSYEGSSPRVAGIGARAVVGEIDAVSVERCP